MKPFKRKFVSSGFSIQELIYINNPKPTIISFYQQNSACVWEIIDRKSTINMSIKGGDGYSPNSIVTLLSWDYQASNESQ